MKIDWSNIETVLLDMDGTLLDLHFDNYFWKTHVPIIYARKNDITPEQAFEKLLPHFQQHMGTLEWYCVCLLYTSPSPRDLSTSRMPSSA